MLVLLYHVFLVLFCFNAFLVCEMIAFSKCLRVNRPLVRVYAGGDVHVCGGEVRIGGTAVSCMIPWSS